MRADAKECPKCHYYGNMEYEDADPDTGIFNRGWFCPECEDFIEDDDDGSED